MHKIFTQAWLFSADLAPPVFRLQPPVFPGSGPGPNVGLAEGVRIVYAVPERFSKIAAICIFAGAYASKSKSPIQTLRPEPFVWGGL